MRVKPGWTRFTELFDQVTAEDSWHGKVIRFTGRPVFVREIAASMQHDMSHSVGATSMIIALLFWLTHRRWKPMLWLLALLMLILGATLALGALVLGHISVVALGFAAVLLGLAVDYAVVHYQEALAHPQMTVPEIRRAIAPSILWAAITTMSAFLVLNLGGLPGLGQLGSLVAIGIALSALVMVMIYLPPLFPERRQPRPNQIPFRWWNYFVAPQESRSAGGPPARSNAVNSRSSRPRSAVWLTGLIFFSACIVLCFHWPGLDRSGNALQPAHGEAQQALDEMTAELGLPPQPLWLIVPGRDEAEVFQRLTNAEVLLDAAAQKNLIGKYLLPNALWPRGENQTANRATAAVLGEKAPLLRGALADAGFNTNAMVLTAELVKTWAHAGESKNLIWPTNQVSQWLLKRFVARSGAGVSPASPGAPSPNLAGRMPAPLRECLVMGLVYPATNQVDAAELSALSKNLAQNHALLSGWELLGSATLKRVQSKMWLVVAPMVLLVLLSLWFAFRRATEILLGLAVLCLSGVCLLAVMLLAGWKWNLMNLMALPLMLGTGVDYSIFIQLALRRHGGDLAIVRRSVGRALMLCGGTAVAGFGSLAFSSNLGMASLGQVCAAGIGANALISIFLLPAWWQAFRRDEWRVTSDENTRVTRHPSPVTQPAFYRGGLWKLGLVAAKIFPGGLAEKNRFGSGGFVLDSSAPALRSGGAKFPAAVRR